MIAYAHMMKHKITMPAMFLRENQGEKGALFNQFSDVAQRLGVYTGFDYVDIINRLNNSWKIDQITNLTDEAEKARDYVMKLPSRMFRIAERYTNQNIDYNFKWMMPAMVK